MESKKFGIRKWDDCLLFLWTHLKNKNIQKVHIYTEKKKSGRKNARENSNNKKHSEKKQIEGSLGSEWNVCFCLLWKWVLIVSKEKIYSMINIKKKFIENQKISTSVFARNALKTQTKHIHRKKYLTKN